MFVIVRPCVIQWHHSDPIEWAQFASNYEGTTHHTEKVIFDYSQKKKSSPQELVKKTDKMAAETSQETPRMGNAKQNRNLEKTQGYITPTLL